MKHRMIKAKVGEIPSKSGRRRAPKKEPAQTGQQMAGFTDIAGTEM